VFSANCVDVFVSHDWPVGVTKYGDEKRLFNKIPHYQRDLQNDQLGNPFSAQLLTELRPRHWFGGHLHCKFEATVNHEQKGSKTEFLALDKCVPGQNRAFFEVCQDYRVIQI
jgi:lariat debranching enzyme